MAYSADEFRAEGVVQLLILLREDILEGRLQREGVVERSLLESRTRCAYVPENERAVGEDLVRRNTHERA